MVSAKFFGLLGLVALASALPSYSTIKTTSTISSIFSTTTSPPISTASVYAQCGGIGFTGPTVCQVNTTCTYQNDFHSQCLPGPNYVAPPPPTPTTTYTRMPQPTWSYVFSFGDSFTDTGFDIEGTKSGIGNQLGNPAWPGLTTAAGKNWLGWLLKDNPGLLSYNFANSGATTDSSIVAPKVIGARSLVDQVAEFTSHLVPASASAPWVTNNTFFVVWIGSNDVASTYKDPNWTTIYPKIIDSYFEQVEILYNAGGRGFILLMVPSLQDMPYMLSESVADQQALTAAITQFNDALNDRTKILTIRLGGNQFPADGTYINFAQMVDPGAAFWFMVNNPTAYGSPDATCIDADGISCLWTDPYSLGQELQSLIGVYVAEIVGLPVYF